MREKLELLVRENRLVLAIVMPIAGAILLVASKEMILPAWLSFNPYIVLMGTALMRLPLIVAIMPLINRRNGGLLLLLTGYVYIIEFIGINHGWPYGNFQYLVELGPMVSEIPMALPLFFIPLVLNGYLLTLLIVKKSRLDQKIIIPMAIVLVILIDLVLDPAAVALGFWSYGGGGEFYGVPHTNYQGWLISGGIAVLVVNSMFDRKKLLARIDQCEFGLDDMVSFVLLWGLVNTFYGNWIPSAIVGILIMGLWWVDRIDIASIVNKNN